MTTRPDVSSSAARRARRGSALLKGVVALALVAGVGYAGMTLLGDRGGPSTQADLVLHEASVGEFDVTLVATGELQARRSTTVRSELETRSSIVSIVDEGVFVKEGDLLVELSSEELRDRLENEVLSLESARSDLVGAKNSFEIQVSDNTSALRQAQVRLDLANLEMRKWEQGTDVEQQRQLALDIESAERELERLAEKAERSEELAARDFLSGDQLKQDRLAHIRAKAELEKARLRQEVYSTYEREMELKQLQNEIDESTAEIDRVKRKNESEIASKQASVTNAERQLDVREQRVEKLREQLAATTIYAPSGGLVVYASSLEGGRRGDDNPIEIGREIRPNEEIIQLPNSNEMVAAIKVHESLVGKVKQGQPVAVRIDALRGRVVDGTVDSVAVVAESGGWRDPNLREYTVRVLLDIDDAESLGIKPSMRCEATLFVERVEQALYVPVPAVFFEDRSSVVYVEAGAGKFERRVVSLGRRSDQEAEIRAGLEPGERVLLRQPSAGEIVEPRTPEAGVASAR